MTPPKSIDKTTTLTGAIPDPTIWTFVHAAVVANLLVATLVLVVFLAMELGDQRGVLRLGLSLIPLVTLKDDSAGVCYPPGGRGMLAEGRTVHL
jgi:hypothetical protein